MENQNLDSENSWLNKSKKLKFKILSSVRLGYVLYGITFLCLVYICIFSFVENWLNRFNNDVVLGIAVCCYFTAPFSLIIGEKILRNAKMIQLNNLVQFHTLSPKNFSNHMLLEKEGKSA